MRYFTVTVATTSGLTIYLDDPKTGERYIEPDEFGQLPVEKFNEILSHWNTPLADGDTITIEEVEE